MTFISYAQNFEDVMLWRALKHIKGGFYIDVGANHPEVDSVTKAFYDHGWRGINIEPVRQWFEQLVEQRPRDINLQLAAGARAGEITLYELPDTGLSTHRLDYAERHEAERGYTKREIRVPMETLTEICERHSVSCVHFLKIDVEGAEREVLEGIDFERICPWIILLEATLPNSQQEDHAEWEPILCNAGYAFVYFDGLNRYYVARAHEELKRAFRAPPNVFDDFVRAKEAELYSRAQNAQARAVELEMLNARIEARASQAEARAVAAEAAASAAKVQTASAEKRAIGAGARARAAEFKAIAAEARTAAAEGWAAEAEARLAETEARVAAAEQRVIQTEVGVGGAEARVIEAEKRAAQLEAELQTALAASHHYSQLAEARQERIDALLNSTSWTSTAPLRWLLSRIRELGSKVPKSGIRIPVQHLVLYARRRPRLKKTALKVLDHFPGLKSRLFLTISGVAIQPTHVQEVPTDIAHLTPRARRIYVDLKTAIERRQGIHG